MSQVRCWSLLGRGIVIWSALIVVSGAQNSPFERSFPQPRSTVERALKSIESSASGNLPILDGFTSTDRPLERYQRAYYKCTAVVSSPTGGGSQVRMAAKITAWYNDPDSAKSGYQVLPSNGRLEADCLERLDQTLNRTSTGGSSPNSASSRPGQAAHVAPPTISAPMPTGSTLSDAIAASKTPLKSSVPSGGTEGGKGETPSAGTQKAVADRHIEELTREAKNLEEILHNQAHPDNLVAVSKAGTPVLVSPSEGAKVLFLADAEDEFEILDRNAAWVHVRISGLSRGWIRRSSVELSDSPASGPQVELPKEKAAVGSPASSPVSVPFQVENEQTTSFPGDWMPLRGKTVKIISVQKTNPSASAADGEAKLEFAKTLLAREYAQLARTDTSTAGLVVIFDSADGGMLAATLPVLEQWISGTLSDAAFWRRCLLDPPDAFRTVANP